MLVNGIRTITPDKFTHDLVIKFQEFLTIEHTLVEKHPEVYGDMPLNKLPQTRGQNTLSSKLKMIKTVLNELEEKDIIATNTFRKIAKREREVMLKESYDEPVYLNIDELLSIVNNDCHDKLERVRDCFLLQCAIGCRIGDFNNLTWNNIILKDNFYYIHYVPYKTSHGTDLKPIDTPLVKFAYDILMKYKNTLPNNLLVPNFAGNVSGKDGYNKQIKNLLHYYKINRSVITREKGELKPKLITDIASSKLCRKTHVDIIAKVPLSKYASGLHKVGSKSVMHYTGLNINEKYQLYCLAFKQKEYNINTNEDKYKR